MPEGVGPGGSEVTNRVTNGIIRKGTPMTTTHDPTGTTGRRWPQDSIDELPPLPAVEEIAKPIVAALYRLHHQLVDRFYVLNEVEEHRPEGGGFVEVEPAHDELIREALAWMDEVAGLVEGVIRGCTGDDAMCHSARRMLYTVAGADDLRLQSLYHRTVGLGWAGY